MNNLTENQEKLIKQIKNEFLSLNESETPKSFADLLLTEIDNARVVIESIKAKSYALFEELHAQYIKDVKYLETECAKLGIGVENRGLYYNDTFHLCRATIVLLHPNNRDYNVHISVAIPSRYHTKSGLSTHELYNTLQYAVGSTYDFDHMYNFNTFVNSKNFKDRVTTLYHKIKK
jgi:hypothetical protein